MDNFQYIVMGPHMWFKGDRENDTLLTALMYFSSRRDVVELHSFKVPNGAYVNEMGGMNFPMDAPFEPTLEAKYKVPLSALEKVDEFADWFYRNFDDPDSKIIEIVNN